MNVVVFITSYFLIGLIYFGIRYNIFYDIAEAAAKLAWMSAKKNMKETADELKKKHQICFIEKMFQKIFFLPIGLYLIILTFKIVFGPPKIL